MSLADHLASQPTAGEVGARTEFDGDSGYVQTAGLRDAPTDFDDMLRQFGYDPNKVQVVGNPRTSRWQVYSGDWLTSYRFHIAPKLEAVDLPALYAEVRKTKRKAVKRNAGDRTIVVCWADVQTGKTDHLGGLAELLERLDEKRAALAAHLKRETFDRIIVADVGDIVEGFDNVQSQIRTNCLSMMDQIDVAATEFWKTIAMCAQRAPVDVLSIPSNHAQWRNGGKNLAGKPGDDWGLHISRRLEAQNEYAGLPVTFHRPDDWNETLTFDVRGTRLGLAHGHQASSPDRVRDWWAKMTHAGVMDCDVLLSGHYHFPSMRPSGRNALTGRSRWHVQASTLDNGSAWVQNKMGEDGDPALTVFAIGEDGFDVTSFALL